MDPQETLYNLLENIRLNDRAAVEECLTTLAEWNYSGGFMPRVDRPAGQSVAHFVVRRVAAEDGPVGEDVTGIVRTADVSDRSAMTEWFENCGIDLTRGTYGGNESWDGEYQEKRIEVFHNFHPREFGADVDCWCVLFDGRAISPCDATRDEAFASLFRVLRLDVPAAAAGIDLGSMFGKEGGGDDHS